MTDPGSPPPPGWQPPPPPPPSYAGQPPPGWAPPPVPPQQPPTWAPGMLGAAHKPGAMPLRPLTLGDMYDAAFRVIRFNPKATVGSAVLVSAVAWVVPIVVTAVLSFTVGTSLDTTDGSSLDDLELVGVVGSIGSWAIGLVLSTFGTILVTGMTAHVVAAAAIGRRLSLGEAWAATRGKRWRLVGLALLLGVSALLVVAAYVLLWVAVLAAAGDSTLAVVVWAVVSIPVFLAFLVWFWVRVYYLPVPALMLEPVGVVGAVARGFALTRRQFWRTLGIALLTLVVVGIAGNVVGVPVSIVAQVVIAVTGLKYTLIVLTVSQALSQVLSSAFVTPFTSSVTSLQYLDQRMRKEAYDVELMQQAGVTTS
ncbi:hypothetical protein G5V58_02035 [Nocardioides anomalus]|uniref:Glycerophosphoryl diester phosphodiesterase membrane domain-containing protein n=1 Tax=Nocardioides anomalus TaxID=2712223 RepID=A0A6G6W9D6_9ACTN|nr:hypothetical protein [Nocardioides anomalus]QIG41715.1 hypothetical protein G5V58_02035 [Nocardioides anomalus]